MIFYMYSFLYLQQYFVFVFFLFLFCFLFCFAIFIVDLFVVVLHKTFFGSALYLLFRLTIFYDFG